MLRTHTDPRNLTRTFDYDLLERLTKITYSTDNAYEQFGYSIPGNTGFNTTGIALPILDRVSRRDRLGNFYYDIPNRLRQVETQIAPQATGAVPIQHTLVYCGCGSPSSIVKASNTALAETTSYVFDYRGNPTTITHPDSIVVNRTYNRLGLLATEVDAYGTTTFTYDNLNRLVKKSNGLGLVPGLGYDLRDRVMANTNSSGIWFTNAYDNLGRVVIRGYADSTSATADGKELWGFSAGFAGPTSYTNQIGKITRWIYNHSQQKTNESILGVYTNGYVLAPAGNILELRDGLNQKTTWTYDVEGRNLTKKDNNNLTLFTYVYNANGWLTSRTTPAKGTTTYTYDNPGNLKTVNYPVSGDLTFNYNELNRITSDSVAGGTTVTYTWRPGGMPESENPGWPSSTVTWGYTSGLRSSLTQQQPTIGNMTHTYIHDSGQRLTSIAASPGTFTYVYPLDTLDPKATRQVTRISLPNTSHVTNVFDVVGRLLSTTLKNSGGTVLNSHTYLVNKAGQRTRQTRTDGEYVNYSYDDAGELREALTFTSGNVAVNAENFKFGYDPAQNILKRTNDTTVTTYTVNGLNQVTTGGSLTYLYDSNGNRTQQTTSGSYQVNYTYDDENQLVAMQTDVSSTPIASRTKTEFTYDAKGRMRTRKEYTWPSSAWVLQSETRYLYDGRRVIQERNASNIPQVSYVRGLGLSGSLEQAGGIGGLLARVAHSGATGATLTPAFYHSDGNGNVTKLINTSQSTVADYKYDPFGRTITSSGSLATLNTYRFSSKEAVGTTANNSALYYYGFRFYDPLLQKWPNRDPMLGAELLEEGPNLYAFVGNQSINAYDAEGLSAKVCAVPPNPCPNLESQWDSKLVKASGFLPSFLARKSACLAA